MKFSDFGAFQKIMQMQSYDKIIFHMLFGAFQVTPRIWMTDIQNSVNFFRRVEDFFWEEAKWSPTVIQR